MTTTAICMAIAISLAGGLVAVAPTMYRKSALWFALALVGQAVSLQLIEAGPALRYQHFLPLTVAASRHPWLLALLMLQAVIVAAASAAAWRAAWPAMKRAVAPRQLLVALALSTCTAATVSQDVARYAAELAFAAGIQVLSLATIVLMVSALPDDALSSAGRHLATLFGDGAAPGAAPSTGNRFGWRLGLLTMAIAALLSVVSYQRTPHVPDEVVYLYQARYFAAGMLTMPPPAVPAGFDTDLMMFEATRWYSPVPPGWPAALAIGARIALPWLVNPVLGGLAVVLTYALLRRLYSERVARYAAMLLALSPWHLFLAMSYMTHTLTLVCALAAAVGIERARERATVGRGVLAGMAVGATSLIRPLDGLIIGLLIAAWAIGIGGRRLHLRALTGLLVGTVVTGAIVFPYNRMLTGDPLKFPINEYVDRYHARNSNAYGFGADRGLGWAIDPNPGHGPVDGLINANLNVFGINTDLFGWASGSLIFVALLFVTTRVIRSDWLMISTGALIFTAYFFYYFSGGPDFGARYWFPIIVPLVALSARGIVNLEGVAGPRVGFAVVAMTVAALATFVPWRAIDKYYHFRGMRNDVRRLASEHHFGRDLVLVRGDRHPDYASAVILNPVDLTTPEPIYAWDRNPEVRAALLAAYPDRRVWLVDGPSVTHDGYQIAAGPLTPAALVQDSRR